MQVAIFLSAHARRVKVMLIGFCPLIHFHVHCSPRHAGASRAILIEAHGWVRLMYFYHSVVVSSLGHFRSYNFNKFERR